MWYGAKNLILDIKNMYYN